MIKFPPLVNYTNKVSNIIATEEISIPIKYTKFPIVVVENQCGNT